MERYVGEHALNKSLEESSTCSRKTFFQEKVEREKKGHPETFGVGFGAEDKAIFSINCIAFH